MAKSISYNINRFDGGMSDDIRSHDLSKCAYVSHFDIYCDKHRLIPFPGYTADQDFSGTDGLKTYNLANFVWNDGTWYCVGTKSDNTGSKLFSKVTAETAEWSAVASGEGTDNLIPRTMLAYDQGKLWFQTTATTNTYLSIHQLSVGTTDKDTTISTSVATLPYVVEYAFDDEYYSNTGERDILKIDNTTITDPIKTTSGYVTDIQSGDEQLGIMTYRFFPFKAQLLLWDSGSILIDRKIEFGNGRESALGYPSGTWVAAIAENLVSHSENDDLANGTYALAIKRASAVGGARTMFRMESKTLTNAKLTPSRSKYRDSMLFYARVPQDATPTTYKEGIFAVGKCKDDSPLAVSVLLDTGTLGSVEGYYSEGNHHYFAHGGDGSVSRLSPRSGTFDITAVYETLMFGHDIPQKKTLKRITVNTEDLPASATVVMKYRLDEDDAFTTMATSSTDGDERHTFTSAAGVPIGGFQEIQFRLEVLGNVAVKGIELDLEVIEDLA